MSSQPSSSKTALTSPSLGSPPRKTSGQTTGIESDTSADCNEPIHQATAKRKLPPEFEASEKPRAKKVAAAQERASLHRPITQARKGTINPKDLKINAEIIPNASRAEEGVVNAKTSTTDASIAQNILHKDLCSSGTASVPIDLITPQSDSFDIESPQFDEERFAALLQGEIAEMDRAGANCAENGDRKYPRLSPKIKVECTGPLVQGPLTYDENRRALLKAALKLCQNGRHKSAMNPDPDLAANDEQALVVRQEWTNEFNKSSEQEKRYSYVPAAIATSEIAAKE